MRRFSMPRDTAHGTAEHKIEEIKLKYKYKKKVATPNYVLKSLKLKENQFSVIANTTCVVNKQM